jgi:hypothetical protein
MMSHLIKIFQDLVRLQSVTAVSISLSTASRAYLSVCDNPSLAVGHLCSQIYTAVCLQFPPLHSISCGPFNINRPLPSVTLGPQPHTHISIICLSPSTNLSAVLSFVKNFACHIKQFFCCEKIFPRPLILYSRYCKQMFPSL